MKIIGALYVTIFILNSCGPNPDDFKMDNLKSTCDCVKMRTDLLEIENDLLESASEREKIKKSNRYKQWRKKSWELTRYWSENFSDNLVDIVKCKEYDALSKELERDRVLHE